MREDRRLLLRTAAAALRTLDESLRELLAGLRPGDPAMLAELRRDLLEAGVADPVAGRCCRVLHVVLSDPDDSPSRRLGLSKAFECGFCGRVPDPDNLVFGEAVSICLACALLAASGAAAPDADLRGRSCGFCRVTAADQPDAARYPGLDQTIFVCAACAELALEIIVDKRRPE
ncbi:hypothetical protein AB0K60_10200 [Thermopolyspora sp. NPDC052614]|uniref:hypothetical protein n=1 Tax=Thermopolyspora sp. NPDC052614 TaxID=3155682 RepID=UPI003437636F